MILTIGMVISLRENLVDKENSKMVIYRLIGGGKDVEF